jgi:acylphosphatase
MEASLDTAERSGILLRKAEEHAVMLKQVRYTVHGEVQMVGYRFFTIRQAKKYSITGYVRNLVDGTVEVVAQGTPEQLTSFAAALKQGPPSGRVDHIEASAGGEIERQFTTFSLRW